MMHYLIVILEHNSTSLCSYEVSKKDESRLIPLDMLKKAVGLAIRNGLSVNFLCGTTTLPSEYEAVIGKVDHMKMVPLAHARPGENALFIIDGEEDLGRVHILGRGGLNNVILRVGRDDLRSLGAVVRELAGCLKRLNIIIKDPGGFTEQDFQVYAGALEDIRRVGAEEYGKGNFIEISTLTDRVFLTNMNNCSAGTVHLTVAPNGRFYLCPAFYYDNEESGLGGIDEAVAIKNARLMELEYAPICRNCDAWHCKRCIYLNDRLTSELNTPSHEQCVLAHLEREASRRFLEDVGEGLGLDKRVAAIPKLDYIDPFDIVSDRSRSPEEKEEHFADLLSRPLEGFPVRDLLRQIYTLDQGMLRRLKELNYRAVDLEEEE